MKKLELSLNFSEVKKRIEIDKDRHSVGKWAEIVGLSIASISNIHGKKSKINPSLEYIVAVAKYTGKPVEWYLYGDDKPRDGQTVAESQMPYRTTNANFMAGWSETTIKAAKQLKDILESGDEVAVSAILSNLHAFHESVKRKEIVEHQDQDIKALKLQVRQLRKLFMGEQSAGAGIDDKSGTGSRKKAI